MNKDYYNNIGEIKHSDFWIIWLSVFVGLIFSVVFGVAPSHIDERKLMVFVLAYAFLYKAFRLLTIRSDYGNNSKKVFNSKDEFKHPIFYYCEQIIIFIPGLLIGSFISLIFD